MSQRPNLSHGRGYLAIPGPSIMPEAVLQAMHRPAPNIYAGELVDMMPGIMADLKRVARTKHHAAIYIGNGHAAWEAALSNVVAAGERVLVPTTGRFGHGFGEMAKGIGADVQLIDFGKSSPMDLAVIADALAEDKAHKIKAVLAVHVDTSSSVLNDIKGLRDVLDAAGHPALLMADCIASLGCDRFEMDDWGVDVMVTGCQKGLMVPLAVRLFSSTTVPKRCAKRCRGSASIGTGPHAALRRSSGNTSTERLRRITCMVCGWRWI